MTSDEGFISQIILKMIKTLKRIVIALLMVTASEGMGQTVIPNAGFDNWTNFPLYSDPVGWDTPNYELNLIPLLSTVVVSPGPDRTGAGTYCARLETKHYSFPLAPTDIPGFMTCGKLTVDFATGSYVLSGGVPVVDQPTHLKGYYKYSPKGGDTCVIGIELTRTTGSVKESIGVGYFSTKDTVTDWTPFSAWIDYTGTEAPDSMNIIAMSTAQEVMTIGTVLYVDDFYLDYTVGTGKKGEPEGIRMYNDEETKRLLVFFDLPETERFTVRLIDMRGQEAVAPLSGEVRKDRQAIGYSALPEGIYLLEVLHDGSRFTRKVFLH